MVGLVEAVDAGLALPLHLEATAHDLVADLDHALLAEREHRVAEKDVLDAEVADQVLHLVDHVRGRTETPLETLPDRIGAVAAAVRAAARCEHRQAAHLPRGRGLGDHVAVVGEEIPAREGERVEVVLEPPLRVRVPTAAVPVDQAGDGAERGAAHEPGGGAIRLTQDEEVERRILLDALTERA